MHITNPDQFGWPAARRFFATDEAGGGGGGTGEAAPASSSLSGFSPQVDNPTPTPGGSGADSVVEGERPVDFGGLGKKKTDPPAATPPPKPVEATPAPAKPPEGDGKAKEPAKAPTAPAKTPEPAKEKPSATPANPAKVEAKPITTEKKEEGYKAPEIPKDDSDVDNFKAKPGSSPQVIKSISDMSGMIKTGRANLRAAVAEVERLQGELKAAQESTGKLPEDIEKELNDHRNFNLLFRAEQDPRFKAEFNAPIEKAEKDLYDLLGSHGLKADILQEIKDVAAQNGGDVEKWGRWGDLLGMFQNPLHRRAVEDALIARRNAVGAKETRLSQIAGSREKFMEEIGKMDETDRTKFAQAVEQASIPFAAAHDFIREQEIPADATPEQKAALTKHNEAAKKYVETYGDYVRSAYERNAEKTNEMAFKAVRADVLEAENAELAKERDTAKARVTELEARLAKIKSAGRIASVESAPADTKAPASKTTEEEGKIGGDGSAAIKNFGWGKR